MRWRESPRPLIHLIWKQGREVPRAVTPITVRFRNHAHNLCRPRQIPHPLRNTAAPPPPESIAPDAMANAFAKNPSVEDAIGSVQMDDVDSESLAQDKPPRWALSADTLTKLLDSARSEVRGYRSLYYALLGFGILALSPITALYRSTSCSGGSSWFVVSVAVWVLGIISLLFGSTAMLPRTRYPDRRVNEFEAINGVALAISATDDSNAQVGLIRAIRATHEIQHRVIERGEYVFLGALLIIISVVLSFVRWAMPCP